MVHFPVCLVEKARDKNLMSQVALLPVCLVENARTGVRLLHSRQEAHVTGGSVNCLPGSEGRSWYTSPPQ